MTTIECLWGNKDIGKIVIRGRREEDDDDDDVSDCFWTYLLWSSLSPLRRDGTSKAEQCLFFPLRFAKGFLLSSYPVSLRLLVAGLPFPSKKEGKSWTLNFKPLNLNLHHLISSQAYHQIQTDRKRHFIDFKFSSFLNYFTLLALPDLDSEQASRQAGSAITTNESFFIRFFLYLFFIYSRPLSVRP